MRKEAAMSVVTREQVDKKNFDAPDELRTFDKGRSEIVEVGGVTMARMVFEPGWRWSTSLRPLVGGESCQVRHVGYMISGHLHTVMDDGTETDYGPGDLVFTPPGHDGWTVGDEPVVFLQVSGGAQFAEA